MSKLGLIIAREYTTRIRKKAFIIMTIIGPVLFAALLVIPIWLATLEDKEEKTIAVVEFDDYGHAVPDSLMLFRNVFENKPLLHFDYLGGMSKYQAEAIAGQEVYYGVLIISHRAIFAGDKTSATFLSSRQPSLDVEIQIEKALENYLYNRKLLTYQVPLSVLQNLKSDVTLDIQEIDPEGNVKKSGVNAKRGVGYAGGFLIYFFILFFGAQVMRGVVEEKTNRIIEVVITSVKPFQLMMGKIIGIGLVGLSQFLIWVILSTVIFFTAESIIIGQKVQDLNRVPESKELFEASPTAQNQPQVQKITSEDIKLSGTLEEIYSLPYAYIIAWFLFYFIGGFLLYGSMFAAIGAAVDVETDTQQFMLPVTVPLAIGVVVMMSVIANPEGSIGMWFSMIPFTSPIIMIARIGFHPDPIQLAISSTILILTFLSVTWLAGKIYRTGILMYGKKISYRELLKWLRYK